MTVLFTNGDSDGPSTEIHVSKGGDHIFTVTGNFDGASVAIQLKANGDPNAEFVTQTNGVLSAAGSKSLNFIPNGYSARAFISSVGASTDVFAEVRT